MEDRKELEEYFDNKYFNEEKNFKEIISKIGKEKNTNKNKNLKIVATLLITIIGTMGIVMATTQIYNTYIKKDESIDLRGLFYTGEGEFGSLYSDEITAGLSYNKESNMYYKIIKNEEEYKTIKDKVNELPDSTEIGFDKNFLMLITHGEVSAKFKERDLTVSEITADNTTTKILLKPKENSDFNNIRSSLYVIVDKTLLRENVNIEKDFSCFKIQNDNIPIDKLPKDYNKEDAIKDGCMVIERFEDKDILGGRVISENKNAFEDFLKASKEGTESYIRIFLSKTKR